MGAIATEQTTSEHHPHGQFDKEGRVDVARAATTSAGEGLVNAHTISRGLAPGLSTGRLRGLDLHVRAP